MKTAFCFCISELFKDEKCFHPPRPPTHRVRLVFIKFGSQSSYKILNITTVPTVLLRHIWNILQSHNLNLQWFNFSISRQFTLIYSLYFNPYWCIYIYGKDPCKGFLRFTKKLNLKINKLV